MGRNNQLVRQWKLLRELGLNHFGLTLEELAAGFEVTTMTVRRDLKGLEEAGFPIQGDVMPDGTKRWRVDSHVFRAPNVLLTLDEALALYLSQQLLRPLRGTQVGEGIQQCIEKVKGLFRKSALGYFQRLADVLYVHLPQATDYSSKRKIIDICILACEDERPLEICYRSGGGHCRQWRLHPYGLVYFHNSLYMIAYAQKVRERRTFKIDRIEEAEILDGQFERPADVNLSEIYEHAFGIFSPGELVDVAVRFLPQAASAVLEKKWHPSQTTEKRRDGSVVAHYRIGDTTEFRSWVLSFGRTAEVFSPRSLRSEICDEIGAMRRIYGAEA